MQKINPRHKAIIRFARSRGFLSPLWILPTSDSQEIQRAFQDLEAFLRNSYMNAKLTGITLKEINDFIWTLKKGFAFNGWEGIAPFMLGNAKEVAEPALTPVNELSLHHSEQGD